MRSRRWPAEALANDKNVAKTVVAYSPDRGTDGDPCRPDVRYGLRGQVVSRRSLRRSRRHCARRSRRHDFTKASISVVTGGEVSRWVRCPDELALALCRKHALPRWASSGSSPSKCDRGSGRQKEGRGHLSGNFGTGVPTWARTARARAHGRPRRPSRGRTSGPPRCGSNKPEEDAATTQ